MFFTIKNLQKVHIPPSSLVMTYYNLNVAQCQEKNVNIYEFFERFIFRPDEYKKSDGNLSRQNVGSILTGNISLAYQKTN